MMTKKTAPTVPLAATSTVQGRLHLHAYLWGKKSFSIQVHPLLGSNSFQKTVVNSIEKRAYFT